FQSRGPPLDRPAFPTRRSSDLTSNGTAPNYPAIAYGGRLAGDPPGTLAQGEATLLAGAGAQTGDCDGAPCTRWGGYASMSVDPRSEEHTSELQSRFDLVCRLLL